MILAYFIVQIKQMIGDVKPTTIRSWGR